MILLSRHIITVNIMYNADNLFCQGTNKIPTNWKVRAWLCLKMCDKWWNSAGKPRESFISFWKPSNEDLMNQHLFQSFSPRTYPIREVLDWSSCIWQIFGDVQAYRSSSLLPITHSANHGYCHPFLPFPEEPSLEGRIYEKDTVTLSGHRGVVTFWDVVTSCQ